MTDKNIRFREPQLPSRPSATFWYDGFFEYDGSIYAFWTSQGYPPDVVRLQRHIDTNSGACDWVWGQEDIFDTTHPEIFRAIRVWAQGGYGEMSLVEFLNATVPE